MSEWISVEDRLPRFGETVVVFGYEFGVVFPGFFSENGQWYDMEEILDDDYDTATSVTHWMPLPHPPETTQ